MDVWRGVLGSGGVAQGWVVGPFLRARKSRDGDTTFTNERWVGGHIAEAEQQSIKTFGRLSLMHRLGRIAEIADAEIDPLAHQGRKLSQHPERFPRGNSSHRLQAQARSSMDTGTDAHLPGSDDPGSVRQFLRNAAPKKTFAAGPSGAEQARQSVSTSLIELSADVVGDGEDNTHGCVAILGAVCGRL